MTNSALPAEPQDPTRRTAFVAGILYLVTFAGLDPRRLPARPRAHRPAVHRRGGADGQVRLGALLDLVNAFAGIGTAVALFSVVKHEHEGLALGFVTTRMFEAAVIAVGVVAILSIVTLRGTAPPTARRPRWCRSARRSSPSATGRSSSDRGWPASTPSCWGR
jgi:hypothetical protein